MPQSPGAQGAPTMVLRLSVPAGAGFRSVAVDVARKVADYVGCLPAEAAKVADTLESLAAAVGAGDAAAADVTFEFHQLDEELVISAHGAGRSSEARHPLSAAT